VLGVIFQPMERRSPWNTKAWGEYMKKSPFKCKTPIDDLERELQHLEATDIVIESGHNRTQIRNDGWPRGGSSPAHPDVRLYFRSKYGDLMYECKVFESWEANLRAICLHLQNTRIDTTERGIGSGGEAYRGFAALPPGASSPAIAGTEWASAMDAIEFLAITGFGSAADFPALMADAIRPGATRDLLYREAARKAHPDTGGSDELMAKVNRARDYIVRSWESKQPETKTKDET